MHNRLDKMETKLTELWEARMDMVQLLTNAQEVQAAMTNGKRHQHELKEKVEQMRLSVMSWEAETGQATTSNTHS